MGSHSDPASVPARRVLAIGDSFLRIDRTRPTPDDYPQARVQANQKAIEALAELRRGEGRAPTENERQALSGYSGFIGTWSDLGYGHGADRFDKLLGGKEWRARTREHGTPISSVIQTQWEMLSKLGVGEGKVLLNQQMPHQFIGGFGGEEIDRYRITAVCADPISTEVASKLYPKLDLHRGTLANAPIPTNFYDAAFANGYSENDYNLFDPLFPLAKDKQSFHAILSALSRVKPGGLVLAFSPSVNLDGVQHEGLRKLMSRQAELVTSFRLPADAAGRFTHSSPSFDLMVLRRTASGDPTPDDFWVYGGGAASPYYDRHPTHDIRSSVSYLGTWKTTDEAEMAKVLAKTPENIIVRAAKKQTISLTPLAVPAPDHLKPFNYGIHNGQIVIRHGNDLKGVSGLTGKGKEKLVSLIGLRDATRALLNAEYEDKPEVEIAQLQHDLSARFDTHLSSFGSLATPAGAGAFRSDPDFPLVRSLEHYDPETKVSTKSKIFTKRVVGPQEPPERVGSPKEALLVSMNFRGAVDPAYIEELTGMAWADCAAALKGDVFSDPVTGEWMSAPQYLSGNVQEKLDQARAAARLDPQFEDHVTSLEAAMPRTLDKTEILPSLGAPWMGNDIFQGFITHLLKGKPGDVNVHFIPENGEWTVEAKNLEGNSQNTRTWGTLRVPAIALIRDGMNQRVPMVYDRVDGKSVLNRTDTEAAKDCLHRITSRFVEWVWEDPKREKEILDRYNRTLNAMVPPKFSGEFLSFPGMALGMQLNPHQKDAVARILQSPNTLVDHEVGLGKTYVMIAAAMKQRQLGIRRRPMIVVPDHLLEQEANDFLTLYPSASVLVVNSEAVAKEQSEETRAKLIGGDLDAVMISYTAFGNMPTSRERRIDYLERQVETYKTMQVAATSHLIKRRYQKLEEETTEKIDKAKSESDHRLSFEDSGVDQIYVDEAHNFKNLTVETKMTGVSGINPVGSLRSDDLLMKCELLREMNKDRGGVVFATGTPISNSLIELHTLMRYLAPDELKRLQIEHVDSFVATFAERATNYELAADGVRYVMRTRLSRFHNLPELSSIYRTFADVALTQGTGIEKPGVAGGAPRVHVAQPSPELVEYQKELVKRAESCGRGSNKDNMLKISGDGRKAALSMKLINSALPDYSGSKIDLCAEDVAQTFRDTQAEKGTQLVFCDLSTPGEGYNVYDDLKKKMVGRGIPEDQIAFIHDHDTPRTRPALFGRVRNGDTRVLIGSTAKMGTGMNAQDRIAAIHDLDAPWRPSDLEQRKGRGLRQGNRFKEVRLNRYVTQGSFDTFMWQTLENKARFINQFRLGQSGVRTIDDLDNAVLSYSQVKAIASGNPLVAEKVKADSELSRLLALRRAHDNQVAVMRTEIPRMEVAIAELERKIVRVGKDCVLAAATKNDPFSAQIGNQVQDNHTDAGKAVLDAIDELYAKKALVADIGKFRGFDVRIKSGTISRGLLEVEGHMRYTSEITPTAVGTGRALENLVAGIPEVKERLEKESAQMVAGIATRRIEVEKPFPYLDQLRKTSDRADHINSQLGIRNQSHRDVLPKEEPAEVTPSPAPQKPVAPRARR